MFGAARALHCLHQRVYPAPAGVGNPLNRKRDWDQGLQLSPVNEEFLVLASHQLAGNLSLPFVHTARRYYRLSGLVRLADCRAALGALGRRVAGRKARRT